MPMISYKDLKRQYEKEKNKREIIAEENANFTETKFKTASFEMFKDLEIFKELFDKKR